MLGFTHLLDGIAVVGNTGLDMLTERGVEVKIVNTNRLKEVNEMDQILGWGTAGGLGILLAGLGVFFWGLQFVSREYWRGGRWTRKEESKK